MSVSHRPVPVLPNCPRAKSIADDVERSYPTGRLKYSRAICGQAMELTITTGKPFPVNVRAMLVTTINSNRAGEWIELPFILKDSQTLACQIVPRNTGLFLFWTRFSVDAV